MLTTRAAEPNKSPRPLPPINIISSPINYQYLLLELMYLRITYKFYGQPAQPECERNAPRYLCLSTPGNMNLFALCSLVALFTAVYTEEIGKFVYIYHTLHRQGNQM